MTKTDYDAQAEAFLKDAGATIRWEFDGFRKHFEDDKDSRNCWRFTIERKGRKSYSAVFGDGIAHTHDPRGKGVDAMWRKYARRGLVPNYSRTIDGATPTRPKPVPPSTYSLLAALTKHDPGSFDDFCGDFGYDSDSRKAEATFRAVDTEWHAVHRLFSDMLERLQEIV